MILYVILHNFPLYFLSIHKYNENMNTYYTLRIKNVRKAKGMTQKELAAKLSISQSFLSELENNKYDMTLNMLFKISEVLNVTPTELVECSRNRHK